MIDAVIYGMIPSANTDKRRILPPANRSKKPNIPPDWRVRKSCQRMTSMPGVGTKLPNRYTASIANVNSTRFRRSGMRKILPIASKSFPTDFSLSRTMLFYARILLSGWRADHSRLASGIDNLFRGGLGEDVRFDVDPAGNLA